MYRQSADTVQLVDSKAPRPSELDRIEPKLGGTLVPFNMDVRFLQPLETVEEKAVGIGIILTVCLDRVSLP